MERSFSPSPALLFGRLVRVAGFAVLTGVSPLVFAGSRFGTVLVTDLISFAIVIGLLALFYQLSLRNTRVDSSPGRLRIRNFVGATHEVAPHHLAQVVTVREVVPAKGENRNLAGARLFVLDDTGRSVLRWTETAWTQDQMRELADSLSLPTDLIDDPITRLDLIARHPRALRYGEVHPIRFLVILLGSIVVATAAIVGFAVAAGR